MLTLLIVRKSVDLYRITYRLYFLVFKKCVSTKFCQRWQVQRWPSVGVAVGFLARDRELRSGRGCTQVRGSASGAQTENAGHAPAQTRPFPLSLGRVLANF